MKIDKYNCKKYVLYDNHKALCLISSLIVHDFSNKKLKKLYPDLKFIPHFIRNTTELKLKILFLMYGTLLYVRRRKGG